MKGIAKKGTKSQNEAVIKIARFKLKRNLCSSVDSKLYCHKSESYCLWLVIIALFNSSLEGAAGAELFRSCYGNGMFGRFEPEISLETSLHTRADKLILLYLVYVHNWMEDGFI